VRTTAIPVSMTFLITGAAPTVSGTFYSLFVKTAASVSISCSSQTARPISLITGISSLSQLAWAGKP